MTASPRTWRPVRSVDGPRPATRTDIAALNEVFSEAFSERYRRDGMAGVRVPPLNPAIWRYAIDDAGTGALCWRDDRGRVVAFNMVHRSGTEGWMGPLCVRTEFQGQGIGKTMVRAGLAWLKREGAKVIGLETMPRTMDNIGFYAALGFVPAPLTITLTLDAGTDERSPVLISRLGEGERAQAVDACRRLVDSMLPGYDFTREIDITEQLALGDTLVLGDPLAPLGYALCHTVPLVEGRGRDELRVLKMVLARRGDLSSMMRLLADYARRSGTRRVAVRLQGQYTDAFRVLVALGARVRWTDLRMVVHGWEETTPTTGMVLSNWEI